MKKLIKVSQIIVLIIFFLTGCGQASSFRPMKCNGDISFDYRLLSPKSHKCQPLVIVFHGYGDVENECRIASSLGSVDNQDVRSCYVLAPVVEDNIYLALSERDMLYSSLKDIVDEMMVSGKVDADRIYVMGNSFGGLATVEFTEKYPDLVAGAVVMCPALSYSQESTSNLVQMKNVPVWFAQATNDNVIPIKTSRNAVSTLQRLGAVEVRFTEFSDEEMLAAGAAYGFHEADIAVMADESFVEWLFDKRKAY
jgi:predicted peptidase